MDWSEVQKRIDAGEDDTTEFKLWTAYPHKVAVAVCALANSEGGLLAIGVDDAGALQGVEEDPEIVQEKLTSLLQSGLSAAVAARLGHSKQPHGPVYWLEIRRYRGPEPLSYRGKVYVRRGRSSVAPSPAELQDLYNTFGFLLTEEQLVPDSGPDDVDLAAFETFLTRQGIDLISQPQPDLNADLRNRMATGWVEQQERLTVYGAICFAKHPQRFLPMHNAWVDLVAYRGTDRADEVILRGEAKGRADEQIERALGWLKSLGIRESYDGPHRKDELLIPQRAFREGVVNAVAHRDYAVTGSRVLVEVFADRVEISSPGTLPNHMTEAAVLSGATPRSRNQLITHFLLTAGLMEQRGRGFPIMRREMQQFNGSNPGLLNSREGGFVRLTLWRTWSCAR